MPISLYVPDPQDIVDIDGLRRAGASPNQDPEPGSRRKFLAIWFRCCHTYGRIYRNRTETSYEGRCPKCGAQVHALIGPGGTDQRMFVAR